MNFTGLNQRVHCFYELMPSGFKLFLAVRKYCKAEANVALGICQHFILKSIASRLEWMSKLSFFSQ